jgi:hypothetical protein
MEKLMITNYAKIEQDADKILHVLFFPKADITEEEAREFIEIFDRLSEGKARVAMINLSNIFALTPSAVKFLLTSPESVKITKACAVVVNMASPTVATGIGLLLKIEKPLFPIQVFTDEEKAKEWLLQYAEKE